MMPVTAKIKHKVHIDLPDRIRGPKQVKVGFPAGKVDGEIIKRAIWNHYGTSRGIPARPFLTNAMRDGRAKYLKAMRIEAREMLLSGTTLKQPLTKLGRLAQGDVMAEITALRTPGNSAATIAQKGSDNPLIWSGAMRGAVTWEIE